MKSFEKSVESVNGGSYTFTLKKDGEKILSTHSKEEFIGYMNDNYPNAKWIPPYGSERVKFFESNPDADTLTFTLTPSGRHSYLLDFWI